MTRKLYYEDAYLQQFQARVQEIGYEQDGRLFIVLDQTAFYPTGGGQPCDNGTIAGIEIVDVEEIEGAVRHRSAAGSERAGAERRITIGENVECGIDWDRRFDHMQQHSGQHILSAVFEELYDIPTIGFHMGHEYVTIDLDIDKWDSNIADKAEEFANRIVMENRPILARFVDTEELAALSLRKPPTVQDNIRIVSIEEFDNNPCGGTHPRHTGEVGPIQILGWETVRGKIRLQFVCGTRAIHVLQQKKQILHSIANLMACADQDAPMKIERLIQERKELDKTTQQQWLRLLEFEAEQWVRNAPVYHEIRIVTQELSDAPIPTMQKLAQAISAKAADAIAVIKSNGEKTQLVLARGDDITFDMNVVLKKVLEAVNGKGGGNSKMAQGGCTGTIATEQLLATIQSFIQ